MQVYNSLYIYYETAHVRYRTQFWERRTVMERIMMKEQVSNIMQGMETVLSIRNLDPGFRENLESAYDQVKDLFIELMLDLE